MRQNAILAAAFLGLAACTETFEERFSSMTEVKAQGMVARGWIPSGLPAHGRDVRVRWNMDTNLVRGMLTVPEDELLLVGNGMDVPDDGTVLPFHGRGSVTPSWWPRELNPPRSAGEMRARGWDLFVVPGPEHHFVALQRAESRLYFWNHGP